MPENSEKTPSPNPQRAPAGPKPRRHWFGRLIRGFLYFLLILVIFHRPLLSMALRIALIKIAARDHIALNVRFSGSFFTNLTVNDVEAHPDGTGQTPIEKLVIRRIHAEYSIPRLIRGGIGAFLSNYEIDDADLVFAPKPSRTKKEQETRRSVAEDLNNILGQPALYADLVRIENFNLTVRSPDDTTEVKGVHLLFHPYETGYLRVDRLHVPGLPDWDHLTAETSYAQRNLFIKGLVLSPDLILDEVNFDASQRAQNKGGATVKAHAFGGTANIAITGTQLHKKGKNLARSYDTTLKIDAAGIDIHAGAAYFGVKDPPVVRLSRLLTTFAGEPESPRTWKGELAARVEALELGKVKIDNANVATRFSDGLARIVAGQVTMGRTVLHLTGQATLPKSINDFSSTEGDTEFQLDSPDLHEATAAWMPQPLSGTIAANGKASIHNHIAAADFIASGSQVAGFPFSISFAKITGNAKKTLYSTDKSAFDGLSARVSAELSGIRSGSFMADTANIDADMNGPKISVRKAEVVAAGNSVSLQAEGQIPKDGQDFLKAPLKGEFTIDAPKLAAFGLGFKGTILSGKLAANGKIASTKGVLGGTVTIDGSDFTFGKFKAQALTANGLVKNNEATLDLLRLQIDPANQIAMTGKVGLEKPSAYEGAILLHFPNLAVLQPLLQTLGIKDELAGVLELSMEGGGTLSDQSHSGKLELSVDKARFGKLDLREIKIAGLYGPGFAESSQLHVVTGATSFEGGLEWRENRLKLRDINLRQGNLQVLSGYISIPFEPQNPGLPIPFEKRIAANINANQLDLDKLFAAFGQQTPVSGTVTANVLAGGTISQPSAHLKVAARALRAKAAPQFNGAEFDLNAHYSNKEFTLDATARQRLIQPLTIKGRAPLDLDATLQKKALDPDLPLDLTVKLPSSSLAFLPNVVPAIRSIAGTAAIDARVSGTVGKPQFGGSASLKIDYARLKTDAAPPIGAVQANLAFTQNSLTVQRVHGDIGGGTFDLGGKVTFPKITDPVFDLRLRSNSILVKRDDSITVRIDTDVTATGPLSAGKFAGTIWVTQSRFMRDIDILPIALPGRPKPQPRSAPSQVDFSLDPPLANWTFDVAIKTRPNDPFQIRGNLANGSAALDLMFGGTGKQPWLEGTIRVENFVASLPFSKLNITRGFITFSRDDAFMPKLDIMAESNLRDYRIHAYIYGIAKDPQVSLTSEPPLTQQDIISLLATGATSSELTGKGDVLASRAAVLLFQQLYRKIFKQRDPSENLPAMDRLNVDVGSVDSRTGREQVSASFKLGDRFYLVGDVDVTGAFTGRLKYLIRFR